MPATKKTTKKTKKKNAFGELTFRQLPGFFLLACLTASLYGMFVLLQPFLTSIFLAAVLAIVFSPVYQRLAKLFGNKWDRTASLLTCFFVLVVIVLPIVSFVLLLAGEGLDNYRIVQDKINSGVFDQYLQWSDGGYFYDLIDRLQPVVDFETLDIRGTILQLAQNVSSFLVSQVTALVETFFVFFLNLIVMFFCMFYFFKDGDLILKWLRDVSPLPTHYEIELYHKVVAMVKAIIYGVFLTAILQGVLGGIGFALAGINNAVFWGTAIAFFSVVPIIGTAAVWVPASFVLLLLGNYAASLFILIWGAFVIGSADNFLRTYFIGGKAKTYPLITFLVILGGIWILGLKGVIVGPLVLMIVISFLHIYEVEYSRVLNK